ncbi:hypothetical protein AFLA70_49g004421 [Aspergillus flavus AF70]|nr:hypothetical protein AFLA70_49g004421 [Aspergillus flavus AF70]
MHFHVKHGILLAAFFGLHLGTSVGAGSSDNVLSTKIESPNQSASETALPQFVSSAVTTNEASPDIIPSLDHTPRLNSKHKVPTAGVASSQLLHVNNTALPGKVVRPLYERAPRVTVQRWNGLDDGTITDPTFVRDVRSSMFGTAYQHSEVDTFARQGYESMKGQDRPKILVGALYIPGSGAYLCSVPGEPARKRFRATAHEVAPAWWHVVKDRRPRDIYHAEDCTAYRYELSRTNKLSPGMTYPEGSYFAVFGERDGETRWLNPCRGGGGEDRTPLDPHCTEVLGRLGIAFKNDAELRVINDRLRRERQGRAV